MLVILKSGKKLKEEEKKQNKVERKIQHMKSILQGS
jgi:hypothetical protein